MRKRRIKNRLTIGEAQHPEAGSGHLGEKVLVASSVVRRVVHLLLGVEPLVGQHCHDHHQERHRRRDRGQEPQAGDRSVLWAEVVRVLAGPGLVRVSAQSSVHVRGFVRSKISSGDRGDHLEAAGEAGELFFRRRLFRAVSSLIFPRRFQWKRPEGSCKLRRKKDGR